LVDIKIIFVSFASMWIRNQGIDKLIELALREDLGKGDVTSEVLINENLKGKGVILAKEDGVLAGVEIARLVFKAIDPEIDFESLIKDGEKIRNESKVAQIEGKVKSILAGERTALNFLQRLSGVATLTSEFVKEVKGTKAKILDTRKTTPGFRALEKYAVKLGGGKNHRMGLYDRILIKDNHIRACGGIDAAIRRVKENLKNEAFVSRFTLKNLKVEVETKNIKEVKEAIQSEVDWIMLDNMSLSQIREGVRMIRSNKRKIRIEVSGEITLDKVRNIARLGADFISVGALTHSAKALDLSLELTKIE
jgi:nicotinate-nucleotide pyrophosphorylase (carboxylating)